MKILVTYFSQTGNTKQIAEAIHETLSTREETDISSVRSIEFEKLDDYDLLFVGAPCHDSDLAPPVKGFLEKLPNSPRFKLVGFFTHSTYMPERDERAKQLYDQWAGRCHLSFENTCSAKNINFLGYFHCEGKAIAPIENFIHQEIITDEDEWNEYLPELRKHPDANDIENAKKYALGILDKL
ncbi:MAG: flavodoxin domain-containing protein [Candidatus Thorarchaeota archaeon]|nr:flavodoxin domain-containing protein [Candidatus Thorarchaeota archaeon]MCK5238322.1 flavodoxin domain-containing protein [Candidatus Thorarchaeota archaeon]